MVILLSGQFDCVNQCASQTNASGSRYLRFYLISSDTFRGEFIKCENESGASLQNKYTFLWDLVP